MGTTNFNDGVPVTPVAGESDLALALDELNTRIADLARLGRDYASLATADQGRVDEFRKDGLRRFYAERRWTFLRPVTTLTCVAGTWQYELPDDFGSLLGPMTFAPNHTARPVELVAEHLIRTRRQTYSSNAVPRFAATRWKSTDQSGGQRMELLLWPTPDAAYVLTYRYAVLPKGLLDGSREYPYGGMQHGLSILYACLAAVERSPLGDRSGAYENEYLKALARSAQIDGQSAPESLGMNGDPGRLDGDGPARLAQVYYMKDGVRYPAE
jgi:hypothetical protein